MTSDPEYRAFRKLDVTRHLHCTTRQQLVTETTPGEKERDKDTVLETQKAKTGLPLIDEGVHYVEDTEIEDPHPL